MRALSVLFLLVLAGPRPARARPYYAAKKALSCTACHINPAGGGPRWPTERSPVRINDSINLGADFRFIGAKSQGNHAANRSSFKTSEIALYIMARPSPELQLVYDNNNNLNTEAYGMWSTERYDLPLYLRVGRFYVPYGLQINDIDQLTAAYIKGVDFSPSVGFSMTNTQSDNGVEVGLNPKKGYFFNLAATNGQPAGAAAANNAKAWTARGGFITEFFALGATAFRNHPLGAFNSLEERAGVFGWTRIWKLVLLGEYDWGRNRRNGDIPTKTHMRAGYAELNAEVLPETLLLKAKFDFVNPNVASGDNAKRRYTAGFEWFITQNSSFEAQARMLTEKPKIKNDQGLFAFHVWF